MKQNISIPKSDMEDTLLYSINQGKAFGYTAVFTFENGNMNLDNKSYSPEKVQIDKSKRFEGMTNPADSMIYYQLSTTDGKKGYFVTAYGPKADHEALDFLSEVEDKEKNTVEK